MFSSDGVIRVFTNCEDRMASQADIAAFEEQVAASHIPTQVGDIDSDKLEGEEALFAPGMCRVWCPCRCGVYSVSHSLFSIRVYLFVLVLMSSDLFVILILCNLFF